MHRNAFPGVEGAYNAPSSDGLHGRFAVSTEVSRRNGSGSEGQKDMYDATYNNTLFIY